MPIDAAKIAQLEKELEEARAQLLKEDGERYRIIMREISEEERERILKSLTDKHERILFGLEAPEESRQARTARPAKSGGNLECHICGKSGLTKRGLALHMVRIHKGEAPEDARAEG